VGSDASNIKFTTYVTRYLCDDDDNHDDDDVLVTLLYTGTLSLLFLRNVGFMRSPISRVDLCVFYTQLSDIIVSPSQHFRV
jgi:hypothetical protein